MGRASDRGMHQNPVSPARGQPVKPSKPAAAPAARRGAGGKRLRSRSAPKERRRDGGSEGKFQTPKSWDKPTGKGRGGVDGEKKEVRGEGQGESSLQRELEKAMLENLQEQNAKLMRKLSKLEAKLDAERSENSQASKHDNTQSTANQQPEPKTPPHNTPMMTPLSPSAAIRYTPGGTRVPSGPPPEDRPQIPEWPESLKFYEVKEEERTTFRDCRQWGPGLGLQRTGRGRWGNKDMGSGSGGMGGSSSRKAMGSNHTSRHTTYRPTSSEERDSKNITNHQQAAAEETEHSGMKRSLEQEEGTDEEDEQVWAERRKYWQKPVSKGPRGASASGREASKVLTAAAKEMRARMYTQEEVDQMLQQHEASKKSEQSKPTTYERGDEGLRSFPITLPQLPEPSIANASLEAGDWLTQVRPLISDVSGNASAWWAAVEEETAKQYHLWLTAAPLDKLKVAAPDNTKLAKGNERLAQRVAVMLMQAVPQGLRQELVASRQMEATHILFRVYKAYQPGGLAERRHTLSQLTSSPPPARQKHHKKQSLPCGFGSVRPREQWSCR